MLSDMRMPEMDGILEKLRNDYHTAGIREPFQVRVPSAGETYVTCT